MVDDNMDVESKENKEDPGLRFQWLFRNEDDSWEDKGEQNYGWSQDSWENIWTEVIKRYADEQSAFWVVCVEGKISLHNNSLRTGVADALQDYTSKHSISGLKTQFITNNLTSRESNGTLAEKGYYLIVYSTSVLSEEVYQKLLCMLDIASENNSGEMLNVDGMVEQIKSNGISPFIKSMVGNVENTVDRLTAGLRAVDTKGKHEENEDELTQDSEVKLRGVCIISDIFDMIQTGEIPLPKQIKAVGRLVYVPAYQSRSEKKEKVIYKAVSKETMNISKEHIHETETRIRDNIDDLNRYNKDAIQGELSK